MSTCQARHGPLVRGPGLDLLRAAGGLLAQDVGRVLRHHRDLQPRRLRPSRARRTRRIAEWLLIRLWWSPSACRLSPVETREGVPILLQRIRTHPRITPRSGQDRVKDARATVRLSGADLASL